MINFIRPSYAPGRTQKSLSFEFILIFAKKPSRSEKDLKGLASLIKTSNCF